MARRERLTAVAVSEHANANLSAVLARRSKPIWTLSASGWVSE
ncbi:MAG TPA: hypothetical protein VMY37_27395 [Thermoguttaceae bacterium]|nr:hypothetical protein [Thermoguttaceae bacterium]